MNCRFSNQNLSGDTDVQAGRLRLLIRSLKEDSEMQNKYNQVGVSKKYIPEVARLHKVLKQKR